MLGVFSRVGVVSVGIGLLFSLNIFSALAQEAPLHQELQETVKARVLEIVDEFDRDIMGTNTTTTVQTVRVELLAGQKAGQVATFDNDLVILKVGDKVFVNRLEAIDGTEYFVFKDVDRRLPLLYVGLLMVGLTILFAGWQGARALLSLGLSVGAIIFLLVPALLAGYSPALSSFVIAGFILAVSLFLTHGLKPRVTIAFIGTFGAVAVTCLLSWICVSWMRLTGFSSDASVYLNFSTGGTLDIAGLLLGSIIIGLLGVLDDVSITQASVVQELRGANQNLGWRELYVRAIRVGRDHVGSLVNTLALAYVGAALPLVLLFAQSQAVFLDILNQEVVAAELLRIMVGSIGLILAVPFTTVVAAWYFSSKDVEIGESEHGHSHHHHH